MSDTTCAGEHTHDDHPAPAPQPSRLPALAPALADPPPLRMAILGAGALGATFGFLLAEAGVEVTLVDVDAQKIAALCAEGVTLVWPDGTRRTRLIPATTDPTSVGVVDLVQISVKGYHTRAAAELALPLLGEGTYVLSLQNGLLNLERIAAVVGLARVVGGVTAHSAMPLSATVIRYNGGLGGIDLARFDGTGDPGPARVVAMFTSAGFPTHLIQGDVRAPLWRKLLANTSTNPVAAITGLTGYGLLDSAPASALIRALAEETAAVAKANGIRFDVIDAAGDFVLQTLAFVGHNKVSMLQDIEAGRRTEVDNLNLAVVAEGERLGVATPLNWAIGQLVRALESRPLLARGAGGVAMTLEETLAELGPLVPAYATVD
ncbi:MAG: 2-dehydropantoate 2-reductase [Actinobacteria bacterium]|nr:2-dehydropantoate 2-reductase [Actinomycetota bacterium]